MIFSEINKYLAPCGYEVFYKGIKLCKRKGGIEGQCTGLEGFFIDTLTNESSDELTKRVLGLIKSELGAEQS